MFCVKKFFCFVTRMRVYRESLRTRIKKLVTTQYKKMSCVDSLDSNSCIIDGKKYERPNCSYTCLIGMALKSSKTGRMTVANIYAFVRYVAMLQPQNQWRGGIVELSIIITTGMPFLISSIVLMTRGK